MCGVGSIVMFCYVFFLKFRLPIGLHSSCCISPTASGTLQKNFTKYQDWPDATQCSLSTNMWTRGQWPYRPAATSALNERCAHGGLTSEINSLSSTTKIFMCTLLSNSNFATGRCVSFHCAFSVLRKLIVSRPYLNSCSNSSLLASSCLCCRITSLPLLEGRFGRLVHLKMRGKVLCCFLYSTSQWISFYVTK